MPALNFRSEFADSVEYGIKRQTVRALRKHPFRQGDTLYLYTNQRTKYCRRLAVVQCTRVDPVYMDNERLVVDGICLSAGVRDEFARADGFFNWMNMLDWFENVHGLPFEGQVIYWDDPIEFHFRGCK